MQANKSALLIHEWLAVTFLVLILFAFSFIGLFCDWTSKSTSQNDGSIIKVFIKGAVQTPGEYSLPLNSKIKDLLALAQPEKNSKMTQKWLERDLVDGEYIIQPKSKEINILIEGAVKSPGWMMFPEGTRFCDLIPLLDFNEETKLSDLKKKRVLVDGETIVIPKYKKKRKK